MRSLMMLIPALLLALSIRADVLNVPGDFPTIQAAMDAAQDGDEIVLAVGIYESPDIVIDRDLQVTVRSMNPRDSAVAAATILLDSENDPLLTVTPTMPGATSVVLDGLTLRRSIATATEEAIVATDVPLEIVRCRLIADGPRSDFVAFFGLEGTGLPAGTPRVRIVDSDIAGPHRLVVFTEAVELIGVRVDSADFRVAGDSVSVRDSVFTNTTASSALLGGSAINVTDSSFVDIEGSIVRDADDVTMTRVVMERITADDAIVDSRRATFIESELRESEPAEAGSIAFGLQAGSVTAIGCTFEDNVGITPLHHTTLGTPPASFFIEGCEFRDNTTFWGAIDVHGPGVIRDCAFIGTRAVEPPRSFETYGSAITFWRRGLGNGQYASEGTIERCLFVDNRSIRGGAVVVQNSVVPGSVLRVSQSIFLGNHGDKGGVVSSGLAPAPEDTDVWAEFTNCVFIGNSAERGGIHDGGARYINCTIVDNQADEGQLGTGPAFATNTVLLTQVGSDLVASDGTTLDPVITNSVLSEMTTGATNTITLAPLFIRPPSDGGDGWGDDPATPGIDESLNDDFGDLRLQPASPAIDAGTNDFFMPGDLDLDGNPRLADDPGIPGSSVDIGAYEFQGASCLADVNQDGMVTPADYNAWILAFNDGSPLADQNRTGDITPADYNAWILNFNATFSAGCP